MVAEWIKNLTEIQNKDWLDSFPKVEIEESWMKNRFFVWQKLKLIRDIEAVEPLSKIVQILSKVEVDNTSHIPYEKKIIINPNTNDRMMAKWNKSIWDNPFVFFELVIGLLPKKKYSFIVRKKKQKIDYDYEFLKLLSKDLNESIKHCEEYYDILIQIGKLEENKSQLFKKYGIEYQSKEEVIEQRELTELKPHSTNKEIYKKEFENIDKLEKSIKKHGQLEPIVITSNNTIISGHRRFKVLKKLGYRFVNVRVRDFENEIESLINFNVQREKRGEDIANEIRYLEKEVYSKIKRGRKKKGSDIGKVDKLSDYANRYEISRTSASYLLQIEKNCPQLIKRIKLRGNVDGDLTINKALEMCNKPNQSKTQIKSDTELKKLKSILTNVDRKDLLELLKTTYPYSILGSYSKLSKSTSFEFDENKFKRLEKKRDEMVSNLEFLKTLDSREILMYNKVDEVQNLNISKTTKDAVYKNLWKPTDIYNQNQTIEEIQSIKPILKPTSSTDEFNSIRVLTHSLYWKQNVGRNLKYIIEDEVSGMYLGLITIASDVVSIQSRDDKIGWNSDNKFKQKKINNSAIASTIVPTQPLGYNFLGTKLIASLCTSKQIRDDWEEMYGDKLVGITTTSLFGSKSSYNGIKWWKKMGTTSGKMLLPPNENHYKFWHNWLKENYSGYQSLIRTENDTIVSGPKQKILNKIFQLLGISPSNYYHENNRGVYYSPLYSNTYEFLRGEIGEEELEPHPNGVGDYEQIMDWWITRAINRYKKLFEEDRIDVEPIWYDEINIDDVKEWLELRGINPLIEEE